MIPNGVNADAGSRRYFSNMKFCRMHNRILHSGPGSRVKPKDSSGNNVELPEMSARWSKRKTTKRRPIF